MTPHLHSNKEKKIVQTWNTKSPKERLALLLEHYDLFWALGLITQTELKVVEATSSSNRDYVLEREDQPFFTSIDLKKSMEQQIHQKKLEAALNAVLFKPKKEGRFDLFLARINI